jgi:hypothetical protein
MSMSTRAPVNTQVAISGARWTGSVGKEVACGEIANCHSLVHSRKIFVVNINTIDTDFECEVAKIIGNLDGVKALCSRLFSSAKGRYHDFDSGVVERLFDLRTLVI